MLDALLRVHHEPFIYICEQEVHNALTRNPLDYILNIENKLKQIATGGATVEMPAKKIFVDHRTDGDFRVMPCVLTTPNDTWKTIKIVGTNLTQAVVKDQITVGKAFCLHPQDNYITHIVEACLLSSARTGVCAVLALKNLAKKRNHIVIVGCGRVGYYCALYALALNKISSITFIDKVAERAQMMQLNFKKKHPHVKFHTIRLPKIISTDILIIATDSQESLFTREQVKAGMIISVGADNHIQRELSSWWSETLTTIFVDSLDAQQVGDLKHWQTLGKGYQGEIIDLLSIFKPQPLPQVQSPIVFISTGVPLFDNLSLNYLVEKYLERNTRSAHRAETSEVTLTT